VLVVVAILVVLQLVRRGDIFLRAGEAEQKKLQRA
jgi:hypothetical protein